MAVKDNELYVYIYNYFNPKYPFQLFIGSRGDGKTYSSLGGAIEEDRVKQFMYSRLTDKEYQIILDKKGVEAGNPFKSYNKDSGHNIGITKINDALGGIYEREVVDGKLIPVGERLGYASALYNIADVRGLDFSDLTDWILDEFVPEKHKRGMSDMAGAFFNAYETMNRNRELDGKPPIYFWGISNANNIYNDFFKGLGIVADCEKMQRKGITDKYYPERGLAVHLLKNSPIFEEKKAQTALYRLAAGTKFSDMALKNTFAYDDFSLVEYRKLDNGYIVKVRVIDMNDVEYSIYTRKGSKEVYVTYSQPIYGVKYNLKHVQEVKNFLASYGQWLYSKFIGGHLKFESYELKASVLELICK